MDQLLFGLPHQSNREQIYKLISNSIESINQFNGELTKCSDFTNPVLNPCNGMVIFGSVLHDWAFSIESFAKLYCSKFGIMKEALIPKLWGDNYYDADKRYWTNEPISSVTGKPLVRSFIQFILDPLFQIITCIFEKNFDKLKRISLSLGVLSLEKMSTQQLSKENVGDRLFHLIMKEFSSATDTTINLIINHLPSPLEAQKYRVSSFYNIPATLGNDEYYEAIRNCDPKGPPMIWISKLIPRYNNKNFEGFYSIGRIFSGSVKDQTNFKIINKDMASFNLKSIKIYLMSKGIQGKCLVDLNKLESSVYCGSIICLLDIDQFISKTSATINIIGKDFQFLPLNFPKQIDQKLYYKNIRLKYPKQTPEFMNALGIISKSFSNTIIKTSTPSDEIILECENQLHLQICIKELSKYHQIEFN
eukprot:gene4520-5635_t